MGSKTLVLLLPYRGIAGLNPEKEKQSYSRKKPLLTVLIFLPHYGLFCGIAGLLFHSFFIFFFTSYKLPSVQICIVALIQSLNIQTTYFNFSQRILMK